MLRVQYIGSDWGAFGSFFAVIACLVIFILVITTGVSYSNQIHDFESITEVKRVEVINQTKADSLTAQFVQHLAKEYPQHEKEVFKNISPVAISVYLAKYPEIKASVTLMALVEKIDQLQSDVYDQQIITEGLLKDIRFRLRNPWILSSFMPTE